ncbi:MAG TPA: hypothetical protein VK689_14635, partial [Armatimonadota bacterium]|nr:hypothetical protein [Armatimonadota bacterium]
MWALSDLKIRTKDRRLVSLVPNAVQALYLDELLPGWRADPTGLRGKREILLKARQFGFSTLILALFFLDTLNTPQTQTVVVAHDLESAKRLFGIVQRFYYSFPEDRSPRARLANQREFYWPE